MVTFSPSKAALRVQVPLSAPKYANMAKLEYAADLKSVGGNTLWVQIPLLAPLIARMTIVPTDGFSTLYKGFGAINK